MTVKMMMWTTMLPIVLGTESAQRCGGSAVHQSRRARLDGAADSRGSVSFSGKRNVSKTHNINSIRLFRVRKAQRRHCANASAVTSLELPKQMATFSGELEGGRRVATYGLGDGEEPR